MPMTRATTTAGIVEPEELRLLDEVFGATAVPNETDENREARAALIVAMFQAGIKDRDGLISAICSPT